MKKLLSMFIILSLVLFSCISCTGKTPSTDIIQYPSATLFSEEIKIIINRPPVGDFVTFNDIDTWTEYVNNYYDIDVELKYISPLHQSAIQTADYYPQAITEDKISGLIELNLLDFRNFSVLIERGLILPLDDYLNSNAAFQSLPASVRESFIMEDGHIWALPAAVIPGIGTRYLNAEWLEKLDLSAPRNLTELYSVSKAFAYDDPNGNGKNDEYGMNINRHTGPRMLFDVFLANDCYISNYGTCSLGFDQRTGTYEEAALKPGMTETLKYVKSLHDDGILHMSSDWTFLNSVDLGNFFDFSNFAGSYTKYEDWTKVYTLSDDNMSTIALKPTKCYVMTSNTENPNETINAFVHTFYSDIEGMATAAFGVPGSDYIISDNKLTHLFDYESTWGQSNVVRENLGLIGLNYIMLNESGVTLESSRYPADYIEYAVKNAKMIEDMYSQNMLFTDSFFLPHQNYAKIQTSFGIAMFQSFLLEIDTIDPDEFVKNYIESQKKAGADKILMEINDKLGLTSTYHY